MLIASALTLVVACSGSPVGPSGGQFSGGQQETLNVAPGVVWLSVGESQKLTAWLAGSDVDGDSVSYSWTSSDPSVVEVDGEGMLQAVGPGSAKIGVKAEKRGESVGQLQRAEAALVTVTTEGQEQQISRILGVPPLQSSWTELAFSATYDSVFAKWGQTHWQRSAGQWEYTYYDRGLAWYAAWWRTGDATFLERGNTDVVAYRDDYVLPNNGHVPPRWVFVEGLAIHYVLTGDVRSAEAIAKMANRLAESGWLGNMLETQYQDGRIQGRAVLAQLVAAEIDAPPLRDWDAELQRGIEAILQWYEASGGTGRWTMASYCGGQANFQVSHALLEALIRYYDLVETDERIPEVVRRSLDYMWQWWDPAAGAFSYNTTDCDVGGTDPAVDLNLLIVWPFGWYYRLSGNELYRIHGDEVLERGLKNTFWSGHKQFNQSFMRSYRYPHFRQ